MFPGPFPLPRKKPQVYVHIKSLASSLCIAPAQSEVTHLTEVSCQFTSSSRPLSLLDVVIHNYSTSRRITCPLEVTYSKSVDEVEWTTHEEHPPGWLLS
jgi:hypothetical protein